MWRDYHHHPDELEERDRALSEQVALLTGQRWDGIYNCGLVVVSGIGLIWFSTILDPGNSFGKVLCWLSGVGLALLGVWMTTVWLGISHKAVQAAKSERDRVREQRRLLAESGPRMPRSQAREATSGVATASE